MLGQRGRTQDFWKWGCILKCRGFAFKLLILSHFFKKKKIIFLDNEMRRNYFIFKEYLKTETGVCGGGGGVGGGTGVRANQLNPSGSYGTILAVIGFISPIFSLEY